MSIDHTQIQGTAYVPYPVMFLLAQSSVMDQTESPLKIKILLDNFF